MRTLQKGILIAIEGIDGSGKSSLAKNLYHEFLNKFPVILTKEPGATPLGQHLRTLVQERKVPICPIAEFLLFATDRAQHFNDVIIPSLKAGKLIISDRLADSSLVYQGFGRGLDMAKINTINEWAMNSIKPDITIYINVTAQVASQRIVARNTVLTSFEKEKQDFIQKLIDGFQALYQNRTDVIIIDGNLSLATVTAQAQEKITTWITQQQLIQD